MSWGISMKNQFTYSPITTSLFTLILLSQGALAQGTGVTVGDKSKIQIGDGATVTCPSFAQATCGSIGIGLFTKVEGKGSNVAIGSFSSITGNDTVNSVTIGASSKVTGHSAISFGASASATAFSTAIGSLSQANGENSVTIGYQSQADTNANNAVVIGSTAKGHRENTVAIGDSAEASRSNGMALGANTKVDAKNSVALGSGSTVDAITQDTTAKFADEKNQDMQWGVISVGKQDNHRRITNVAGGSEDYDAVNVKQLTKVNDDLRQEIKKEVSATDGTYIKSANTAGQNLQALDSQVNQNRMDIDRLLKNNGTGVGQLQDRVGNLEHRLDKETKQLKAGVAGALAIAGLQHAVHAGKSRVSASVGTYGGEGAVAIGYSRASDNGKYTFTLGTTINTRNRWGGNASVGYEW